MAADDLSTPLAPKGATKNARQARSWVNYAAAALVASGIGFLGWISLQNDPMGGQPFAVVSLENTASAGDGDQQANAGPTGIRLTIEPSDDTQPEARNFAGSPNVSAVQRGGDLTFHDANTALGGSQSNQGQSIIHRRGSNGNIQLSRVPDRNLIEQHRLGALPKIGPQGQRASVVYARPANISDATADNPQIALLITGLGISASGTSDAIQSLPGPVSLAFAPYGNDLQRWVGKARRNGHEVMLQIPMEPFDFPDNDPGPHTLLTGNETKDNLKRLRWLMSRFTGYIGITNYMGTRFTGVRSSFEPVLREISDRGLLYLDDGSSPRSIHDQIAPDISLQSNSANVVIDSRQNAESIDQALQHLESMAYRRGRVIGVASALPLSIERIAAWAAGLEEKGIVLIPVSAVYSSPAQS